MKTRLHASILLSLAAACTKPSSKGKSLEGVTPSRTFINEAGLYGAWTTGEVVEETFNGTRLEQSFYIFADDNSVISGKICTTSNEKHYLTALAEAKIEANHVKVEKTAVNSRYGCTAQLDSTEFNYYVINNKYMALKSNDKITYLHRDTTDLSAWNLPQIVNFASKVKIEDVVQLDPGYKGLPTKSVNQLAQDGTRIYAATNAGLYVSEDAAQTWTALKVQGAVSGNARSRYAEQVLAAGQRIIVKGYYGISLSDDQGATWRYIDRLTGLGGRTPLDVVMEGEHIFVGTEKGISQSHDFGKTWSSDKLDAIFKMLRSGDRLYLISGAKLFSANIEGKGEGFTPITNVPTENQALSGVYGNGTQIFVQTADDSLFASSNGGETWQKQKFAAPDGMEAPNLRITDTARIGEKFLVFTSSMVWAHDPAGNTLTKFMDLTFPVQVDGDTPSAKSIMKVGNAYLVNTDSGLFKAENDSSGWQQIRPTHIFGSAGAEWIAVSGDNVYAIIKRDQKRELSVSSDGAKTWTVLEMPTSRNVSELKAVGSHVAIKGEDGLFISRDKGRNWARLAEANDADSFDMDSRRLVYTDAGNQFWHYFTVDLEAEELRASESYISWLPYGRVRRAFAMMGNQFFEPDTICTMPVKNCTNSKQLPGSFPGSREVRRLQFDGTRLFGFNEQYLFKYSDDYAEYQPILKTDDPYAYVHKNIVVMRPGWTDSQYRRILSLSFDGGSSRVDYDVGDLFETGSGSYGFSKTGIGGDGSVVYLSTEEGLKKLTLFAD